VLSRHLSRVNVVDAFLSPYANTVEGQIKYEAGTRSHFFLNVKVRVMN